MERYVVGAGLFAVAGALLLGPLLSPARAEGTSFSQCAVMGAEFVERAEALEKRTSAVPPGWTPIGGSMVLQGPIPRGGIVLCR